MDIFNNAKKLGFGLMRLPRLDPNDEGRARTPSRKR